MKKEKLSKMNVLSLVGLKTQKTMKKTIILFTVLFLSWNLHAQTTTTGGDLDASQIQYWIGSGDSKAIFVVNWSTSGVAMAWGYKWDSADGPISVAEMMSDIDNEEANLSIYGVTSFVNDISYDDGNINIDCWNSGGMGFMYSVNNMMASGIGLQGLNDGDVVYWECLDGNSGWNVSLDPNLVITLAPNPTPVVSSVIINPTTIQAMVDDEIQLTATVMPLNVIERGVIWSSTNAQIATVNTTGNVTALTTGTVGIVATTVEGGFIDTCHVTITAKEFKNGLFVINEESYGHGNGSVNFLGYDGIWHYDVYNTANPGKELGGTSQYGTIYGNKFYIVSKKDKDPGATITGSRLAVCDAETMQSLAEFPVIATDTQGTSIADGHSFLGVDEHKGYIGTNNGIYLFDIDNLSIGNQLKGSENTTGGAYTGQIGTMVRAADKVFAVHQQKGILVIDLTGDSVQRIISAPVDGTSQRGFGSIVQSKDGNLWLSVASSDAGNGSQEYMLRLNPYTLDTTRIILPNGAGIPNSWSAWTADGFCSSTQSNKLYWKNDAGLFNATKIYEYDIDNNTTRTVIDLSKYEPSENWGIYGAGFRLDPLTNQIFVSLFKPYANQTSKMIKVDPSSGSVTASYPIKNNNWYRIMPVFPDNYAPVISGLSDIRITQDTVIYLGDKVSDADNMNASIVKSIVSISNEAILKAIVKNDTLIITPSMGQSGISNIDFQFNSNGKVVTKSIAVEVHEMNVTSVVLDINELTLEKKSTYQLIATVFPKNATNKNITWESSNISIVTVDENGLITAVAEGEANITVTTEDGKFTDVCIVTVSANTVGIDKIEVNKAKIYPTVTTGKITIVQEKTIEDVQIVNLSGKLLQTFNLHSLESTIDISSYQSGLYLVRIGNQVVKIIKQ